MHPSSCARTYFFKSKTHIHLPMCLTFPLHFTFRFNFLGSTSASLFLGSTSFSLSTLLWHGRIGYIFSLGTLLWQCGFRSTWAGWTRTNTWLNKKCSILDVTQRSVGWSKVFYQINKRIERHCLFFNTLTPRYFHFSTYVVAFHCSFCLDCSILGCR